jgi:hypothetical protein
MKTILSVMLLGLPMVAFADYVDVIEFKLNDGCKLETELQNMRDFNTQWGVKNGYKAEILTPVQSPNLTSLFWVGRTKDAATFGKAWDTWSNELKDPNTVASKLLARFVACGTNLSRRGYDVYN